MTQVLDGDRRSSVTQVLDGALVRAETRVNTRVDTKNASVTLRAIRSHQAPGTKYREPSDDLLHTAGP